MSGRKERQKVCDEGSSEALRALLRVFFRLHDRSWAFYVGLLLRELSQVFIHGVFLKLFRVSRFRV